MKKIIVTLGLAVSLGCSEAPYIDYSILKDEIFESKSTNKAEQYANSLDENSKTKNEVAVDVLELYVRNGGPNDCKNSWFNPYTKRFECLADDFWETPGKPIQQDVGKTQGLGLKNGGKK